MQRRERVNHDSYRVLLNSVVADVSEPRANTNDEPLPPSRIGISDWSSRDKDAFFDALVRYGKDDTLRIAQSIGTKTEAQVREYVLLLEEAKLESAFDERQPAIIAGSIPAAFEIHEDCDARLDLEAEALALRVEQFDANRERDRSGEYWLLTNENADSVANKHPFAELLHLANLLELSHIFMSSDGEWSPTETNDEGPSIFFTAYSDLHNLVISLTRRLVQTALFQAMSRIRSTTDHRPSMDVRFEDVHAAVLTLGLKDDWSEFWVGCARRNKLDVFTFVAPESGTAHRSYRRSTLNYDEVELALRKQSDEYRETRAGLVSNLEGHDDVPEHRDRGFVQSEDDFEAESDAPQPGSAEPQVATLDETWSDAEGSLPSSRSPSPLHETKGERDRAHIEEAYLESLDVHASRIEETRLWSILGRRSLTHIEQPVEVVPPTGGHALKRKRIEESRDWRLDISYRAEWEIYNTPIDDAFFTKRQQCAEPDSEKQRQALGTDAQTRFQINEGSAVDHEADREAGEPAIDAEGDSNQPDKSDDGLEETLDNGGHANDSDDNEEAGDEVDNLPDAHVMDPEPDHVSSNRAERHTDDHGYTEDTQVLVSADGHYEDLEKSQRSPFESSIPPGTAQGEHNDGTPDATNSEASSVGGVGSDDSPGSIEGVHTISNR